MEKENKEQNGSNRRKFIKDVGIGAAAIGAGLATSAVPAMAKKDKKYRWKMVTTWPPHFPVLGEGADMLAKWIEEMSDGRLKISVYGGGELVPALGVFDAVSQGTVEMGHAAAYYWAGKCPSAQFFAAIPFGFNAQSMNAWMGNGGGIELWEEAYKPFNVKPFVAGNTGVQMGGWFNKEINSMDDLKGLKMRMPGLGGKIIAKAGANAVLVSGGEIYTNLERGVIDATEWIGPYHDYLMGFYKAAKYYYYPGWHETGTPLEAMVNLEAFNSLPKDLQAIVETACARANVWMLSEFEAKNNQYLRKLIDEEGVKLREYPKSVLTQLKKYSFEVLNELADKDPMSRKAYDAYQKFQKNIFSWNKLTEEPYQKLKYL